MMSLLDETPSVCSQDDHLKKVAFADDAAGGGSIKGMSLTWEDIKIDGPPKGGFPKGIGTTRCMDLIVNANNQLHSNSVCYLSLVVCYLSPGANVQDSARGDISAIGFWNSLEKAFFDVRVFNPLVTTNWTK